MLEKLDIHLDISRTFLDEILEYHLEYFLGVRDEGEGGFDGEDDDMLEEDDDDSEDEKTKERKETLSKEKMIYMKS